MDSTAFGEPPIRSVQPSWRSKGYDIRDRYKKYQKEKDRGATGYNEYEIEISGETWQLKTEIRKDKKKLFTMPLKRNSPTLARLVEGTIGVSNYFRCKYTTNISILQEYEQKDTETIKMRLPIRVEYPDTSRLGRLWQRIRCRLGSLRILSREQPFHSLFCKTEINFLVYSICHVHMIYSRNER